MKTTLYTILLAMTAMLVACDANYTTEAKVNWWWRDGLTRVAIRLLSLPRA